MITQYPGTEMSLHSATQQESASAVLSAGVENPEKKELQCRIGIVCARSFSYALQTEQLNKFFNLDGPNIKILAERVNRFVAGFFLSTESSGKSDRLEVTLEGELHSLVLLERHLEDKPITLFIALMTEILGEGSFKKVYRARKITLHPDKLAAIEHCIGQIDSSQESIKEILKYLGVDAYVYSKALDTDSNPKIVFGVEMHALMMRIPEIAASPHCPALPERPLPPLYPDKVPQEVEFFQSRFNTTFHKANLDRAVPLTDLKGSLTVPFNTKNFLELYISVAQFLKLLHQYCFVHRDIKEDNIGISCNELDKRFRVIVFDFDIVRRPRIRFQEPFPHDRWDESTILGSALPSSDVYSLVVMLALHEISHFEKSKIPSECNIIDATTLAIKNTVKDVCEHIKLLPPDVDFSTWSSTEVIEKMIQHIQSNTRPSDQKELIQQRINVLKKNWLVKTAALELLAKVVVGGANLHNYLEQNLGNVTSKMSQILNDCVLQGRFDLEGHRVIYCLNEKFGLSLDDVLRRLEVLQNEISKL
ncbi:MAG: hypothetical protein WCF65_10200 [Parachlamydiaceae bacterium]